MATCFFIGHRDAKDSLLPALIAEVERHILEYGVTEFVVGRYGRFDGLAAQAVKQAKERHPNVALIYLRPYTLRNGQTKHRKALTALSTHRGWSVYRENWLLSRRIAIW